jgi:peptidyl-prolyl cis-trans isomerase B (cyclophilin B)
MPGDDRSDSSRMYALIGGIVILAVIVIVVLLTRDSEDEGAGDQTASACKVSPGPEADLETSVEPPEDGEVLEEGDEATAVVTTNLGEFSITLDTEQAPITANSFAYLAEEGFYDGLTFHRIVPGFVIQGGDPQGNGTGGPGYSCVEKPPANLQYTPGVVAMAKSGPEPDGTSGSQFFVVTGTSSPLPPQYALVGEVTDGFDVAKKIGELGDPTDPTGRPTQRVEIESIEIEEG